MPNYRFIGSFCECGSWENRIKLNRWGQLVDFTKEAADVAISEGAALIPDADFKQYGFTQDEIQKFWDVNVHYRAPETFRLKLDKLKHRHDTPVVVETKKDKPVFTATRATEVNHAN